jgi:hypothetical protein
MLNLFVAIIVSAMENEFVRTHPPDEGVDGLINEMRAMRQIIDLLERNSNYTNKMR